MCRWLWAARGRWSGRSPESAGGVGLGGGGEGDGVAGGFELVDVVVDAPSRVVAAGVEVGAEVVVGLAGGGHVPGGGEDGVGDGDGGLVRSSPAGDTAVAGGKERVFGSCRGAGCFDQSFAEVSAAVPGSCRSAFPG